MKEWYTAKEFAESELLDMPRSERAIQIRAKRENWESQKRMGQGGGYEYHISNLPREARQALEAKQIADMLPQVVNDTRMVHSNDHSLTERQRTAADARTTVLNAIDAMNKAGISKQAAMTTLLTQATTGELAETSPVLDKALRMAKDTRGRGKSAYPSVRSLKRWLSPKTKTLAPKSASDELKVPVWAKAFLAFYQQPEKPSVASAYRLFQKSWNGELPSIHAVRRFLGKVGNVTLQQGRMGSREIKNIKAFVRRSFDELLPADVYSADGHTFDAEVAHPYHGRPFRPEITTFIDIATRKAVGYSIDLAESGIAVLDALIDACTKANPAMLYVDNGSGYCNALLKDESLGVLARLGTEVRHSLPYNSQARGVIERVHQTLWIEGAKQIPGYIGHDMDREASHTQHKLSRKAIKEGGKTHLLSWENFIAFCEDRIEEYNARPHTSLPKITDTLGVRRHRSPDEQWAYFETKGWQADVMDADQAAAVFRPRVTRKVLRCEIRLNNNRYFSRDLEEFHGDQVQVAFDFRDAQWIWVYAIASGRLICKAEWNANQAHYMPMSYIMQAREKRAAARLKRLDAKREEIELERSGNYALEQEQPEFIPGLGNVSDIRSRIQAREAEAEDVVIVESIRMPGDMTPTERMTTYQHYMNGAPVPEEHEFWVTSYPKSKEFASLNKRYAE